MKTSPVQYQFNNYDEIGEISQFSNNIIGINLSNKMKFISNLLKSPESPLKQFDIIIFAYLIYENKITTKYVLCDDLNNHSNIINKLPIQNELESRITEKSDKPIKYVINTLIDTRNTLINKNEQKNKIQQANNDLILNIYRNSLKEQLVKMHTFCQISSYPIYMLSTYHTE